MLSLGGLVSVHSSDVGSVGHDGVDWSGTSYEDVNMAFRSGFNIRDLYPSNTGNRQDGYSVRWF